MGSRLNYETIAVEENGSIVKVILNRPDRRNSFNSQMISDLNSAFGKLKEANYRCVVLTGEGKAFSAGADLDYMRSIKNAGNEANISEAMLLADLLEKIYTFPAPVIARINGPAIGGGLGLITASDIAIADENAFFAFSEVRLGLAPAVIGPFVVKAIGEKNARRYMLTGDRITTEKAIGIGLIQQAVSANELDTIVDDICASILASSPYAVKRCKELIRRCGEEPLNDIKEWTAELIAELRAGEEGQEGMNAFFEKRKANWVL